MIPELTMKLAVGSTALLETAFDKLGIPNPQSMLPFLDHIAVQLEATDRARAEQTRQMKGAMNGQGQQGAFGGAGQEASQGGGANIGQAGMAPGVSGNPGMV
jgi:hypothetical protein